MQYNYKMLHYCQRCNKEHDRTHEPMFDTSVKCEVCNGFVVSPSGRAIIRLVLTAGMYVVYGDTMSAWIGAENKDDALELFKEEVEPRFNKIIRLNEEEIQETTFCYPIDEVDENGEAQFIWLNGKDVILMTPEMPAVFMIVENELITKMKDKKDKGDS